MFVVGVGEAAGHTTEIVAVSGPNGPGLNVAVNDFSLTSDFDDLAASLRALVFSLCQSTMTVTKLVDGQPDERLGRHGDDHQRHRGTRVRLALPVRAGDATGEPHTAHRRCRYGNVRLGRRLRSRIRCRTAAWR